MKMHSIIVAMMAVSFGLTLIHAPHLWYWAGLNLMFAIICWMDRKVIDNLMAKVALQGHLLDLAAVIMAAKERVADRSKEGAGPWG